jgi:hypothetical protein
MGDKTVVQMVLDGLSAIQKGTLSPTGEIVPDQGT